MAWRIYTNYSRKGVAAPTTTEQEVCVFSTTNRICLLARSFCHLPLKLFHAPVTTSTPTESRHSGATQHNMPNFFPWTMLINPCRHSTWAREFYVRVKTSSPRASYKACHVAGRSSAAAALTKNLLSKCFLNWIVELTCLLGLTYSWSIQFVKRTVYLKNMVVQQVVGDALRVATYYNPKVESSNPVSEVMYKNKETLSCCRWRV